MPDDTPGINLKGYFQEKKGKNATPISKGQKHEFGPPPTEIKSNAAQKKGGGKTSQANKKSKEGDSEGDSDEQ
jgi:hypothetical protein